MRLSRLAVVLGLVGLMGCPKQPPKPDPQVDASAAVPVPSALAAVVGNAAHGKELVASFQCNRCHDGTGHPAAEKNKHCVHCHKDIMEDRFTAPPASIARWKPRVKELQDAPSLEASGARFTRKWVESYLLTPTDMRPFLHQTMPRLALTSADARDIAAYLVPSEDKKEPVAVDGADLGKGRQLLETKGCGTCHTFSGVAAVPASPTVAMAPNEMDRGHRLAPDLRFTRDRMTASKLMAWLKNPQAVKPDTAMKIAALTDAEVKDLTGYLLSVEITSPPTKPKVQRLPVLDRKVTFKEVDEKVFHRTCWHCHSEPDYAIGDGGPGNSGGFGFKPRGLNLSDYTGIAAGYIDNAGERSSVFLKDSENIPRIVKAMLARYDEEAGSETGAVRGMPLGYEPVAMEDIQLVETWVSQGRPR